jgi:phage terminase large subunit-like protein
MITGNELIERIYNHPDRLTRAKLANALIRIVDEQAATHRDGPHEWHSQRRESQTPPDWDWFVWLLMAGRGFGKTRTGAGWIDDKAREAEAGEQLLIGGRTPSDVRDYALFGQGGLLTHYPDIRYEPSKRALIWPNGAIGLIRSGANPEEFRGFSGRTAWLDEFAAWDYPRDCWDNLKFGVREQGNPQICMTTTPKPIKVLREIIDAKSTALIRGSSYENRENLSEKWIREVLDPLKGTRLGRQEIAAELLEDVEGALWNLALLEKTRVKKAPDLVEVCVAVDPAVTADKDSDETGIVAAGKCADGHGYILDDVSGIYLPLHWAKTAIGVFHSLEADYIVAEVNQGGDMVETTIHTVDERVPVRKIHAKRGKYTRAEPVSALYEQNRAHHAGIFPELEDEQCSYTPGSKWSPSRMDAAVWALTSLMFGKQGMIGRAGPKEKRR